MTESIVGTIAGAVVGLLVVVAEFEYHVVSFAKEAMNLGPTVLAYQGGYCQSAFGIIGYSYTFVEESWNHLSPACPWLVALIDYSAVAQEI